MVSESWTCDQDLWLKRPFRYLWMPVSLLHLSPMPRSGVVYGSDTKTTTVINNIPQLEVDNMDNPEPLTTSNVGAYPVSGKCNVPLIYHTSGSDHRRNKLWR